MIINRLICIDTIVNIFYKYCLPRILYRNKTIVHDIKPYFVFEGPSTMLKRIEQITKKEKKSREVFLKKTQYLIENIMYVITFEMMKVALLNILMIQCDKKNEDAK